MSALIEANVKAGSAYASRQDGTGGYALESAPQRKALALSLPLELLQGGSKAREVARVKEGLSDAQYQRLACAALANLAEEADNFELLVDAGAIPQLMCAITTKHASYHQTCQVKREACRCLGNLAASISIGELILAEGAQAVFVDLLQSVGGDEECSRMAAMALANLSSNMASHGKMLAEGLLEPVQHLCMRSLDPKAHVDAETVRYALLIVANLSVSPANHPRLMDEQPVTKDSVENGPTSMLGGLAAFSSHRDIKCRQNAVLAIGNLCANFENLERIVAAGCIKTLATYAFPSNDTAVNVQFQAVAGLRGLAAHDTIRIQMMEDGVLEPLMLAATAWSSDRKPVEGGEATGPVVDPEVQREVAAALMNLALAEENKVAMVRKNCVPAIIALAMSKDRVRQTYAVNALANLCEMIEGGTQQRMLDQGLLKALGKLSASPSADVRRDVGRCYGLLATKWDSQDPLIEANVVDTLASFTRDKDDTVARFAVLALGNLAVQVKNHQRIFDSGAVAALMPLAHSADLEVRRGVAFALNNIATSQANHRSCETLGVLRPLVHLLKDEDRDVQLQTMVSTRQLCSTDKCSFQFIDELQGLKPLLALGRSDSIEIQREVAATLRNLSLGPAANSSAIVRAGGIDVLNILAVSSDVETSHQALGVIATLAETIENQRAMLEGGILQRLKFILRSKNVVSNREAVRALANLSSEYAFAAAIAEGGAMMPLSQALMSSDFITQRYAALGLSNLAANPANQERVIAEGALLPLVSLADGDNGDLESRRFALAALGSVAASRSTHPMLGEAQMAALLARTLRTCDDAEVRSLCYLGLANLAVNASNHRAILQENALEFIIAGCHLPAPGTTAIAASTSKAGLASKAPSAAAAVQVLGVGVRPPEPTASEDEPVLRCVSALRGLSCDADIRNLIVRRGGLTPLLAIAKRGTLASLASVDGAGTEFTGGFASGKAKGKAKDAPKVPQPWERELEKEAIACLLNLSLSGCIGENPVRFLQACDAPTLVSFLCSADATYRLFGATALGNVAAAPHLQARAVAAGALDLLITVAANADLETQRCAAYAIGNFAMDYTRRAKIVAGGGLPPLISLACSEDASDQKAAMATLRGLAASPLARGPMVAAGALDAISRSAQCDTDVEVTREAAAGLAALSLHGPSRMLIATHFVMNDLIGLCRREDVRTVRFACSAVANLAEDKATHPHVVGPQGCRFLCDLTERGDVPLVREACRALANLAGNYSTHAQLMADDTPSALAAALRRSDAVTCRFAALAILNLTAQPENQPPFFEPIADALPEPPPDAPPPLVLLEDGSTRAPTRSQPALTLGCHEVLVDVASGAPRVWIDVAGGSSEAVASAAAAAATAAADFAAQAMEAAVACGDEALMVKAEAEAAEAAEEAAAARRAKRTKDEAQATGDLGYDVEARRYACLALANLLADAANHRPLLACGVLDCLRESLSVDDTETRFNAAFALTKLCMVDDEEHRQFRAVGAAGLITPLVKLVGDQDDRTRAAAMSVLRRALSTVPENRLEALEVGLLGNRVLGDAVACKDGECRREAAALLGHLSLSWRARRPIVGSHCLMPLLELCSAEDPEAARCACGAIANIAEDVEGAHRMLIFKASALHPLTHLMRSKHLSVVREASRAVGNLLNTEAAHPIFIDENGLMSLFLLARSSDNECQFNAAIIYRKLAPNMGTHASIFNYPDPRGLRRVGVHPLLGLAQVRDRRVVAVAAAALFYFASNQEFKVAFAEAGGLKVMIACGREEDDRELRMLGCGALRHLSLTTRLKKAIVDEGGLGPLLDNALRKDDPPDGQLLAQCAATLANVAEDYRNKGQMPRDGVFPALCRLAEVDLRLVDMDGDGTVDGLGDGGAMHADVSRCFCSLSSIEANVSGGVFGPRECTALFHLAHDASPENEACCRDALIALGNLAVTTPSQQAIAKLGGIPPLSAALSSPYASCRLYGARALYRLGVLPENMPKLVEGGAVASLLTLCRDGRDAETQRCAVMALTNITACAASAATVGVKLGAVAVLVDLLGYGPGASGQAAHRDSRHDSRRSSRQHSNLPSARAGAGGAGAGGGTGGGGGALMAAASRPGTSGATSVHSARSCKSTAEDATMKPAPGGWIDVLVTRNAAMSLVNLLGADKGCQDACVAAGGLPALVGLASASLPSPEPPSRAGSRSGSRRPTLASPSQTRAVALASSGSSVGSGDASLSQVSAGSGQPPFVGAQTLGTRPGSREGTTNPRPAPDPDAVRYAGLALSNLSTNRKHRVDIVRAGGLRPLVRAMGHASVGRLELRRGAAVALYNLSCATSCHPCLAGTAPPIALGLSAASGAAVPGVSDACMEGAVECLASLAEAGEADIARLAVMAVANLASSSAGRLEATRHGGLQCTVVAANAEDSDVRLYASVALQNMANGSPAAQAAVVNHGGLLPLLALARSPLDVHAQRAAAKGLLNLTTNAGLVPNLVRRGVLELLVSLAQADDEELRFTAALSLCNLAGSAPGEPLLAVLVTGGALGPLMALSAHENEHCRRLALIGIRRLSHARANRCAMVKGHVLPSLVASLERAEADAEAVSAPGAEATADAIAEMTVAHRPLAASEAALVAQMGAQRPPPPKGGTERGAVAPAPFTAFGEQLVVQREVIVTLCNLSQNPANRVEMARHAPSLGRVIALAESRDLEVARHAAGCLANLTEDLATHTYLAEPPHKGHTAEKPADRWADAGADTRADARAGGDDARKGRRGSTLGAEGAGATVAPEAAAGEGVTKGAGDMPEEPPNEETAAEVGSVSTAGDDGSNVGKSCECCLLRLLEHPSPDVSREAVSD